MSAQTEIWDKLRRVPPEYLKEMSRPGGFKGTAIKPMWTYHRMTEVFGPCGTGWGINEPSFQTIAANKDLLVFCTVSVWYETKEKLLWGIGGDRIATAERTDDECFKKAFTDAVTNALKALGAGADIHMGLWDGSKYKDAEPASRGAQLRDKTDDWEARQPPAQDNRAAAPAAATPSAKFNALKESLDIVGHEAALNVWLSDANAAVKAKAITSSEQAMLKTLLENKRALIAQRPAA